MNKKIAILFSGGLDSTAVAVHYLKRGYETHLLTFDNGAQKWLELAGYKAERITRQFPDRCSWRLMDCTFLFHRLAIENLEADVKKYGNLICCGCKLAMLCEAIVYCEKNGITELADGFKKEQDYYPEQTPEYMELTDALAKEFGISCVHPLYDMEDLKPESIALSGAIPTSPIQPYCIFGQNPVHDKSFIASYVKSKLPAMKKYMEQVLTTDAG